jgi:hypothetical protein
MERGTTANKTAPVRKALPILSRLMEKARCQKFWSPKGPDEKGIFYFFTDFSFHCLYVTGDPNDKANKGGIKQRPCCFMPRSFGKAKTSPKADLHRRPWRQAIPWQ